jgi:hypothetical protein
LVFLSGKSLILILGKKHGRKRDALKKLPDDSAVRFADFLGDHHLLGAAFSIALQ